MTKEEMLNLRLYECNRKRCGDKCSHDISGCHLTHEIQYAVNPEQSVGWDYFVGERLDEMWTNLRAMCFDAIVHSNFYPVYGTSAVEFLEEKLTEQIHEIMKLYSERLETNPESQDQK